MNFYLATQTDIPVIQQIVNITWPVAYSDILSKEQIDYMLDLIYSDDALSNVMNSKNQLFFLAKDENNMVLGFFAVEHNYKSEPKSKLHKIYILPEKQGEGIGKLMMNEVIELSKIYQAQSIVLNVNRFNKALNFYKKIGFEIIETIDIEIGNNYFMEDYILQLQIKSSD